MLLPCCPVGAIPLDIARQVAIVIRPGCVFRQLDLVLCRIRALASVCRLLHFCGKVRQVVDEILEVRLGTETAAVRRDIPIPVEREHLFEPHFEVRQVWFEINT